MASLNNSVLPPGSKILVTGVNGYIASHVADQALNYGYLVRGVVRSTSKNKWMIDFFEKKFGKGSFELAEVADYTKEGAFSEAMKGVHGVVHTALILDMSQEPAGVVQTAIDSTLGILKSAAMEKEVKRFVFTSSAAAAALAQPHNTSVITRDSWNEESVELAKNLTKDAYNLWNTLIVYGASKSKGERALWKWVQDNQPELVVNTGKSTAKTDDLDHADDLQVLPGVTFGKVLSVENQGYPSTANLAHSLLINNQQAINYFIKDYPPLWFVDVQDNARLHIAALTNKNLANERIFAYAETYNWNTVLKEFRVLFPDRTFMEDVPGIWDELTVIEQRGRVEEILKDMGREGYTSLRESLSMLAESH